jgi:heat shock protein HslJ
MAAAGFSRSVSGIAAVAAACAPLAAPVAPPLADIAGTRCRVVQVNGRATPATGDYSLSFEAGRLVARFGCNHIGGRYSQTADIVSVSDLAQTLMGCPEPSNSFESQGAAVLGAPMRIAFSSNERLFLSNPAGSIALDPAA